MPLPWALMRRFYHATPRRLRHAALAAFQRAVANRTVIASVEGCRYALELGEVIDFNLLLRNFEREVVDGLRQACRPGMVIVDIGANIGAHCLPISRLVQPHGCVYAFEPTDFAFAKLTRNLSLNPGHRVTAVKAALSDVALPAQRVNFRASWRTDGSRRDGESVVDFIRLDDWAAANGLSHVDVLKIDTDGNEFDALSGGAGLLAASRPLIFMEAVYPHFSVRGRNPFELLGGLGYRFHDALDRREFASIEAIRARLPENDSAMSFSINVIASTSGAP